MAFPINPDDNTHWTENHIKYVYSTLTNSWRRDFNNVLDRLYIGGTYTAVSTTTGAVQVAGGVGIQGDLYAANIFSNGSEVLTTSSQNIPGVFGVSSIVAGTGTHINTSTGEVTIWTSGGGTGTSINMTLQDVTDYGSTTYRAVSITNNSVSTNTVSGALTIVGGTGIGGNLNVGGTGKFSSNGITIGNSVVSSYTSAFISTDIIQNLDTFSTSTFRSARYVFQIVDVVTATTVVHITEMNVFHDNRYVYMNEYGIASSSGILGVFDAVLLGGIVTITFKPTYTATNMVIKGNRTAIAL
jgi:hypothetical protein